MLKLPPSVLRFQPERIADRHEGEEPAKVVAEKPILSLTRALNKPLILLKLFMKAEPPPEFFDGRSVKIVDLTPALVSGMVYLRPF
jgi:hypothetical protein